MKEVKLCAFYDENTGGCSLPTLVGQKLAALRVSPKDVKKRVGFMEDLFRNEPRHADNIGTEDKPKFMCGDVGPEPDVKSLAYRQRYCNFFDDNKGTNGLAKYVR